MIHYQTYTAVEAEKLVDLWNRSFGPEFPLDLPLWRQNVDECNRTFPDTCVVAVRDGHLIGAIVGKNPNRISTLFVAPEYRRRGIATELLERAEVAFTGELETTLIVGQDDRHFFPGVPEHAEAAHGFFIAHGFQRHEGFACDMVRPLADWQCAPPKPATADALAQYGIALQACTAELVPALLDHVGAEFSDRWLRDTLSRLKGEPDPEEIVVAVEGGANVVGFCHTYTNRSRFIGPSIAWRALLGTAYGGLGPIGVAKERRKIGLGLELLKFAVTMVADAGAQTMVIDWTNIVDFYAKVGFTVWKRYVSYTKSY